MFDHLKTMNIGYFDHWKISMNYSAKFAVASIKALIHAFLPDFFETSSTDLISELYKK